MPASSLLLHSVQAMTQAVCGVRLVGDNEGNLQGFDSRQKEPTQAALNIHDKKINTIHVSMLSCRDKNLATQHVSIRYATCIPFVHLLLLELLRWKSPANRRLVK